MDLEHLWSQLKPKQTAILKKWQTHWKSGHDRFCTILAEKPGGGKTRMALAAHLIRSSLVPALNRKTKNHTCLIVGKKDAQHHWIKELHALDPALDKHSVKLFEKVDPDDYDEIDWARLRFVFVHPDILMREFKKCIGQRDRTTGRPECPINHEGVFLTPFQRSNSPLYQLTWDWVVIDESMFLSHPFWTAL